MPSSLLRLHGQRLPPDLYPDLTVDSESTGAINVVQHMWGCAPEMQMFHLTAAGADAVWPAANRAIAYPLYLPEPFPVTQVWWSNGATVGTDSVDVGVYDEALNLLTSGGGATTSGASVVQKDTVTPLILPRGRYYVAMAVNGTTDNFPRVVVATVQLLSSYGCFQMASAHPLPSAITPARISSAYGLIAFGIADAALI